ncbi:enoyl-CoA hydratase [compost metagenome]
MQTLGAVNQVVEEGEALTAALALGAQFSRSPRRALERIKQLTHAAYSHSIQDQMALEGRLMVESQGDDEAMEGITAFLEKRPADFQGLRKR